MDFKISKYVRIKDHRIYLDDKEILALEKSLDLQLFLKKAYLELEISYPKFHKMDNLSKLGILATDLLFRDRILPENTALIFSNYSSSLGTDIMHQSAINETVSPSVFVYTLPNVVMGEICIKYKINGENAFFISEDFDPDLIWEYSDSLLQNKVASAIVCGWIEWKNDEYDVFLCLITREGDRPFSAENLKALYNFENE
jgi:hypothetical protein